MGEKENLKLCLETVKDKCDKCSCILSQSKLYELNLESGEIALLRTTINNRVSITVIKNHKKGSISINKIDKESVFEASKNVLEICESSEPDEAFDIAPFQEKKEFTIGESSPNLDKMYDLFKDYVLNVNQSYKTINLMETAISFNVTTTYLMNSNGVDFKETKGIYGFSSSFAAKDLDKSSSFNYSGFTLKKIENDLLKYGSLERVLSETTNQIYTNRIMGKFKGDIIITPDCLDFIVNLYISRYLQDVPLISKTSLLKDKINEQVASPLLTLHSKPRSNELANGYYFTSDGFEAYDLTIIDKGILKSFLLSQYGANKTNLERAKNSGGCYIIEPGKTSLDEMIKTVKRGVYVNRMSGGNPNENGDMSVILKNSFYIENGEIKYPLSETMISTNLYELFRNILEISEETINFGDSLYPYVKVNDVLISGK